MQVKGTCLRKVTVEKIIIVQGVFSILIDFTCAAFPVVLLRNAKMNLRTKIGLCLLMGLAFM